MGADWWPSFLGPETSEQTTLAVAPDLRFCGFPKTLWDRVRPQSVHKGPRWPRGRNALRSGAGREVQLAEGNVSFNAMRCTCFTVL